MESSLRKSSFDPAITYVRLMQVREDGFVELEFAVGEPELFVEMILPQAAFADFCVANHAKLLPAPAVDAPRNDWEWRLRDALRKRLGD